MKNQIIKVRIIFSILMLSSWFFNCIDTAYAQNIKWLRIGGLQAPINETGAEYEVEFSVSLSANYFSWPAQYGINQTVERQRGLMIGCKNFNDPVENKVKSVKVIGTGFKAAADPYQIFPQEFKLIGKSYHPKIFVDGQRATDLDNYDVLDEVDPTLLCDRMVLVKFNTSMGITVTKKVMAFANSEQGNYFIYDYVFKNTGIIDQAGTIRLQTMDSVWMYFLYRYAFGGVTSTGFGSTWGAFASQWGLTTLNHAFGENPAAPEFTDPTSPLYQLRGFYSYYGPFNGSPRSNVYEEDWGCPKLDEPGSGTLGSAKYAGCATLHADINQQNHSDDINQPKTTWFISPDISCLAATSPSQYDETFMSDRWSVMTEGHPIIQHDDLLGNTYPGNYVDSRRNVGGGVAMGQGFGPYNGLAPGDSIHIGFVEGVSGLSWEKGREIGANWLQWHNGTGTPQLILPDGSTTVDANLYKRRWCETGRDNILKTYRNAKENYTSGFKVSQPPPPPNEFAVTSSSNQILLEWSNNATTALHFGGYVIYRAEGSSLTWTSVYTKIFETNNPNLISYIDTTAIVGYDYYYYIQSKDDGTQINGKTLTSSLFLTLTNTPARLSAFNTGAFRSHQSGNWNDSNSWEYFNGSAWIKPALHAPSNTDGVITIREGHTITVSTAHFTDQLMIKQGGALIVESSAELKVMDSDSTDMVVFGTVSNYGSITQDFSASIEFSDSSKYIHRQNGGSIPKAIWARSSICEIIDITNTAPSNTNQNFGYLIWDCPNQNANLNLHWQGMSVHSLTVKNTNWNLVSATNPSYHLGLCSDHGHCWIGDLIIHGPNTALETQSGAFIDTIDIGNITISSSGGMTTSSGSSGGGITISSGGLLFLSNNGGISTYICNGNILFPGYFIVSDSGYIGNGSLAGQSTVIFRGGLGTSYYCSTPTTGTTYLGGPNFLVEKQAILSIANTVLVGSGNFVVDSGATIITSHPAGLDGNIQVTGTKAFGQNTNYTFNSTTEQVTGNLLPDNIGTLIINNDNNKTVTLSKNIVVNNALKLLNGEFSISSNSITVNGSVEIANSTFGSGSSPLTYGANTSLLYSGTKFQTTTNVEFPSVNGPKNLSISNSKGVTLHESRAINGTLSLAGKLIVNANTIMAAAVTSADTNSYIMTEEGGGLKLASVGSTERLFPVGTKSAYTPVWVMNTGTVDTIYVGAMDDYNKPADGGRVKARWNIDEQTPGAGTYRLKLGWMKSLEDSAFSVSNLADWKIFKLPELTEPGSGTYSKGTIVGGRFIRRSSVTILGTFTVGTFTTVDVKEKSFDLPTEFRLSQNYPNPFNPMTTFSLGIPSKTLVSLKIYDLLGREIVTLVSEELAAGNYTRQWNAANMTSGIYFYRLQAGSFTETKKLILLK